jgi:hypothetical protein
MESKGLAIVIIGSLMLGLGLQHTQVSGSCSTPDQEFCLYTCSHTWHQGSCFDICGCNSLGLLQSKSGTTFYQLTKFIVVLEAFFYSRGKQMPTVYPIDFNNPDLQILVDQSNTVVFFS